MASFLSTTSIASLTCFWRPQQGSRIDIGERGDWPVSVGEDVKKAQCWENMKKGEAVAGFTGKALDEGERKLGCLRHR